MKVMTRMITRKTHCFLTLAAGMALALALASPAFAGKPQPKPSEPCLDLGLGMLSDLDQDGLPDLIDCQGVGSTNGDGSELANPYPGCLLEPGTAPHCTDYTRADVFAELQKDTGHANGSAYDDTAAIGTAILDDEVFSFANSSLALQVHVLPVGGLGTGRLVWTGTDENNNPISQAGVVLVEDRSLTGSCTSPGSTGVSFHGNPNEFGEFNVLSQRILDKIECVSPGDQSVKRQHLLNTSSHEFGHGGIRQAPDADSFHQDTRGTCLMEASIEPDKRGNLTIPTDFCSNSQQTILDGVTTLGPTFCGDTTTFDGDGLFGCLPKTASP